MKLKFALKVARDDVVKKEKNKLFSETNMQLTKIKDIIAHGEISEECFSNSLFVSASDK